MFRFPDSALPLNLRRTGWATLACLAVTAVLAGCGGGERVSYFTPNKIVSFGDEYSAFEPPVTLTGFAGGSVTFSGLRYSVNAVISSATTYCATGTTCDTTTIATGQEFVADPVTTYTHSIGSVQVPTVIEKTTGYFRTIGTTPTASSDTDRTVERGFFCTSAFSNSGNWVQSLAMAYGSSLTFGGAYCPADGEAFHGNAQSYAAWGSNVASTVAQINASLNRGELGKGTLVTVFAGQQDVITESDSSNPADFDAARALMAKSATDLVAALEKISNTGAKVIVVNVPNLGLSPLALRTSRAARLQLLSAGFNRELSNAIQRTSSNAGRRYVIVDAYAAFGSSATSATDFACDVDNMKKPDGSVASSAQEKLLYCTSASLKVGGSSKLWADESHLGPAGHATLAALAYSYARQNF